MGTLIPGTTGVYTLSLYGVWTHKLVTRVLSNRFIVTGGQAFDLDGFPLTPGPDMFATRIRYG